MGLLDFTLRSTLRTATEHDQLVEPGAFERTLEVGSRLTKLIRSEVHYFAVLTSEDALLDWDQAWARQDIPGQPHVRLAPIGGSLTKLADALARCSESFQKALMPSISYCLRFGDTEVLSAPSASLAFGDQPVALRKPSACDIRGAYNGCSESCHRARPELCPGVAVGWSLN